MSLLSRIGTWFLSLFHRSAPKSAFDPAQPLTHVLIADADAGVAQSDLDAMAAGLQAQLREDFSPEWIVGAADVVRVATPNSPPRAGEVQVQFHKLAPDDESGALAIHDFNGVPICHVYAGLARQYGASLSSCASHEILEARADPTLDRVATLPDGRVAAVEVADACEESEYSKLGTQVTDFSTMDNFGMTPPPSAKRPDGPRFDFLGLVKTMFAVLQGGYAQIRDPERGWIQLGPDQASGAHVVATSGHAAYRAELTRRGISRHAHRARRS